MAPDAKAVVAGYILVCMTAVLAGAEDGNALRSDAVALATARDTLVKRLDGRIAQNANGPAMELALEFADAIAPGGPENEDRRGIAATVGVRGRTWYAGTCASPKYSKAVHDADPGGLTLSGGKLGGRLLLTVNADKWVPADGKSRKLVIEPAAVVADGTVNGTARLSGDYGSYTGVVKGTYRVLPPLPGAAGLVTPVPGETATSAEVVRFASTAYQEARAALLCLANYPVSYTDALASVRLSPAYWKNMEEPGAAKAVAAYVRELRDLVAEAAGAAVEAGHADGSLQVTDSCFGPRFGDEALPVEDGVSVLPENAGDAKGGQRWQCVGRWDLLAVFPPDPLRLIAAPSLPEVIRAAGAVYDPDTERLGSDYRRPDRTDFAWTAATSPISRFAPPGQRFHPVTGLGAHGKTSVGAGIHGVTAGRWYGAATIRARNDCELYAAVMADDFGKLWVNGRLAWMSRRLFSPYALIKIRLRKGDNRLVLGCENESHNSAIALSICTRGGPMAVEEREAMVRKCREATLALPPLTVRGRHGDWKGTFADATPPLAWDLRERINILWHVPLPDYSCAPPVVVGDRVYVNCEPHTLYCLNKDTGAVLWKRDAHVFEFLPEDSRAEAMKQWETAANIDQVPEVKAWDEQIAAAENELREDEDSRALNDEQRAALQAKIDAAKKEKQDFVRARTGSVGHWKGQLGVREPGWSNNYGWTFGAPVADGKHVWVKYASGVAACFDRDGNRRWIAHTRLSGGCGNISSPVLLRNTFVIQGAGEPFADKAEWARIRSEWPPFYNHVLMGLDADTGKTKWVRPVFNTGGYGGATGIVPLRLSNGKITREAVLNGDGLLVDPEDGRLLSDCRGVVGENANWGTWAGDPVVHGNRAYFGRGAGATVIEYWLEDGGGLGWRFLFRTEGGGGKGGVMVNKGLCGGTKSKGSVGRHPVPWHEVSFADAETGKAVAAIFPVLREGGLDYVAAVAAGDYMVACGSGPGPAAWAINPKESAQITFIKCDPEPWVATTCKVRDEAMVAAPTFDGDRMYLRTYRSAMCVQVRGKAGQEFVSRTKADELFAAIGPRPLVSGIREMMPTPSSVAEGGVPVEECVESRTAPKKWLFAGPIPIDGGDPLAGAGGASNVTPKAGTVLAHGGRDYPFRPVADEHVEWAGGWSQDLYKRDFYTAKVRVDLSGVAERRPKTSTYFYAVLHTAKPRTMAPYIEGGTGTQAWLAGVPIKNDETLSLAAGHYPLLIKSSIQTLPDFIKKVGVVVTFRDIPDPRDRLKVWLADVRKKRARLEEVVRELPDSAESRTAAAMLKFLEP